MKIVATVSAGYAEAGYVTIVDGIISPRWFFEPLRDALEGAGHTVAYAVLRAPLELVISRAAGHDRPREVDATVIEQLWGDFADLGALERHAIETGGKSPEQVAEVVAKRLRGGELDCEPGVRPEPTP